MNYEAHPISQNRTRAYLIVAAGAVTFAVTVVGSFFIAP